MTVSVYIAQSLDGYIARENGDIDWLQPDDEEAYQDDAEDYGFKSFMESVDVLIMGRHTFEKVLSFEEWPYGNKRVFVLSSSLLKIPSGLHKTVEIKSGDPKDIYHELCKSRVGHVYVDGGKTIMGFLKAGLVDEMIITTIPVLIGTGIPLFGTIQRGITLELLDTRSFRNGFIQSRYRISKEVDNTQGC
jgi:dihydrofolate reductase